MVSATKFHVDSLIFYKGKHYVPTSSLRLENEDVYIIVATCLDVVFEPDPSIPKICARVPAQEILKGTPEGLIPGITWHPISMIDKLNAPLFKALYE